MIYAATDSGVFKSINGGTTWAPPKSGLPSGSVYALEIDPSAPGAVYAGTNSGPYQSSNRGSTWVAANTGHPPAAVIGFARDPKSGAIYAASNAGVFVSPDRGATWAAVNSGFATLSMGALVFDSAGTLYAGTSGAGVFRLVPESPDRPLVQGSHQHPPPRAHGPSPLTSEKHAHGRRNLRAVGGVTDSCLPFRGSARRRRHRCIATLLSPRDNVSKDNG